MTNDQGAGGLETPTEQQSDDAQPARAEGLGLAPAWVLGLSAAALLAGVLVGAGGPPSLSGARAPSAPFENAVEALDGAGADGAADASDGDDAEDVEPAQALAMAPAVPPMGLLDPYAPAASLRGQAEALGWRRGRAIDEALRRAFAACDADGTFFGERALCRERPSGLRALLRLPGGAALLEARLHVTLAGGPIACAAAAGPDPCAPAFAYAPESDAAPSLRPSTDGLPFLSIAGRRGPAVDLAGRTLTSAIGVAPGDLAIVLAGDRAVAALVADLGPPERAVAGSLALFTALGAQRCLRRAADGSRDCLEASREPLPEPVLVVVFPGSAIAGLQARGAWLEISDAAAGLLSDLQPPAE